MKSNITQKNLLEEGFWNRFKQVGQLAGEVGKVVMPKTAGHIENIRTGIKSAKTRVRRAGWTKDQVVKEQIIESGFYPYTDKNGEAKIKWGRKNSDGTITGSIKVGELGYEDDGTPYMAAKFKNQLKSDVIFRYDPSENTIKIVRAPYRQSQVTAPQNTP